MDRQHKSNRHDVRSIAIYSTSSSNSNLLRFDVEKMWMNCRSHDASVLLSTWDTHNFFLNIHRIFIFLIDTFRPVPLNILTGFMQIYDGCQHVYYVNISESILTTGTFYEIHFAFGIWLQQQIYSNSCQVVTNQITTRFDGSRENRLNWQKLTFAHIRWN